MTVDMLAATFFWPEGTLLGPPPADDDAVAATAEDQAAADDADRAEGFWAAVMRHVWRPTSVQANRAVPQG